MVALVGYTGFVGSNLYAVGKFDRVYNSRNIQEAYGSCPDLLIYAGIPAEKYLANSFPEKDINIIQNAVKNIQNICPKKLVLISTIDVYQTPCRVNEDTKIQASKLQAYGKNRYYMETCIQNDFPESAIIRLPGLFGKNIKKNFIYDYINKIPSMLTEQKFDKLSEENIELKEYYVKQDNGYFKCRLLNQNEHDRLKNIFDNLSFNALNFTDSRSVFQFYPLYRLWNDIQCILKNDIKLWNPATEPISVSELYFHLSGKTFQNETSAVPAHYDYRTKYDYLFGHTDGYIMSKKEVIEEIKKFVESMV